jgi:hypothetical protein
MQQPGVGRFVLTEGAVVLEGLGDFTLGEVSEVVEDGGLGELEVVFGLDKPKLENEVRI